jgi:hypothetical protein
MKKAVVVRMPDRSEGQWPTTGQLELYIYFWYHQRIALAPDPGSGDCQKSFWLDAEDLDREARRAGCLRSSRPDRALFVRRIIATYHKRMLSRPIPSPVPAATRPTTVIAPTGIASAPRQVLQSVAAPTSSPGSELNPTQVNEISRRQGLGIGWQPGNVYRIGRTATAKSCLVQFDVQGRELARYGSW